MATEPPTVLDIYARVSRLGDKRMRSTSGQADDCKARITELGAQVGEILTDEGRSAWNPRVRRPRWDRLMERLESGATGGVVVFDLARFSRRPIEGERLISAAERGLLVLDSEGEYDLTSASGKKAFRDQLSSAAYESDRLSTRVKRGKKLKAISGEAHTSTRPFGFEIDGTIRQSEAEIIRDLTDRVLAGESQDALIVELNERGILTSYGKPWTRAGLRQVLTRPRNAGRIVHLGVVVATVPGERITEEDVFDRLVALYASRRRGRPVSDAYLCSGNVRCGLCEHILTGRPRANMKPYPDGEVRRQYWCQPRSSGGGCGRISVDQRELDRHVGALVVAILSDPRHADAVEAAARDIGERRGKLDAEIAEAEEVAEQLAARLGKGEITLRRYDAAARPLDRRLAELRAERDRIEAPPEMDAAAVALAAERSWAAWSDRWDAATVPERRRLVRMALRGRKLVIGPADASNRADVAGRIRVE
ncbi:recombinase family protein [Micromonospora sp. WMMD1082]|uniref:recombinase family protein n=1 Tax=Micromonospora sp. WMMD1082 TaxID=3016104 RepID=UPI00241764A1|nr:recombinase family protein [Micromonospora sp. WMMD1082]MDG4792420.1 recombinase family protein [Micromonospora sp. WMMD1082]